MDIVFKGLGVYALDSQFIVKLEVLPGLHSSASDVVTYKGPKTCQNSKRHVPVVSLMLWCQIIT